jgi:hypothetical protein
MMKPKAGALLSEIESVPARGKRVGIVLML